MRGLGPRILIALLLAGLVASDVGSGRPGQGPGGAGAQQGTPFPMRSLGGAPAGGRGTAPVTAPLGQGEGQVPAQGPEGLLPPESGEGTQGDAGLDPSQGMAPSDSSRARTDARRQPPGTAPAPRRPSVIEASFRIPETTGIVAPLVEQFGYAVFTSRVSTFAPVDDVPVGPDYVLGPGDELWINVWGQVDTKLVRRIDRNGKIFLPKVGDLRVWGLTFAQAEQLIRDQLSRYFKGFETSITMGRLRTIRVHVVGEVERPGAYMLSSLSTLSNALFAAGGPTKLGSLREIWLRRNHQVVGSVDLYDFFLRGDRSRDFRLESGDTVFVPPIGNVVAVGGAVKRPAIYEIRGEVRLADVLEMAGGVTPRGYLRRVQVVRSQPSAEREVSDVDVTAWLLRQDPGGNPRLENGDFVLVQPSDPRIYNTVRVSGAVKYPGVYEVKPGMRLSQLLPPTALQPIAHAERVEIARRRPDLSVEVVRVNLVKAWGGDQTEDPLVQPLDEISVRTELREARTITLNGEVVRPGAYVIAEGERLSSVLERAGGFTEKAYLRGAVFTRASLRKIERQRLDEFVRAQEQRILASASAVVVGVDKDEAAMSAQAVQARRELLRALAARVVVGRMVLRLDEPGRLRGTDQDIVLADGDALDVPEPTSSVLVIGAVRTSASVLHELNANVEYYVERAGGFAREADRAEVHIVKADGSGVSGFSRIRTIEPGDTIVVPPKEEERYRWLPVARDIMQVTASTIISLAALATLF